MRRYFLSIIILFSLLSIGFAQPKLGLKFSPIFVNSRPILVSDTLDIENDGSKFKFSVGLIVDQSLTDTYYISTGLIFMPKHVSIKISGEDNGNTTGSYKNAKEEYRLQYLQIPLTLKLYTNEIAPDLSIYFQVGGMAEFKIFDGPVEEEYTLLDEFNGFDTAVILGTGAEFRAGINTVLFFGGSYQRGLLNSVASTAPTVGKDFTLRSGLVSIDLGLKF